MPTETPTASTFSPELKETVPMTTGKPVGLELKSCEGSIDETGSRSYNNDPSTAAAATHGGRGRDGKHVKIRVDGEGEENSNLNGHSIDGHQRVTSPNGEHSSDGAEKAHELLMFDPEDTVTGGWRMEGNDTCNGEDTMTKPLKRQFRGYGGKNSKMNRYGAVRYKEDGQSGMSAVAEFLRERKSEWRLMGFVIFLFILIIVGLVVIHHRRQGHQFFYETQHLTVDEESLQVTFRDRQGQPVLVGTLWKNNPERAQPFDCSEEDDDHHGQEEQVEEHKKLCLKWKKVLKLEVEQHEDQSDEEGGREEGKQEKETEQKERSICHRVRWTDLSPSYSSSKRVEVADCFHLEDGHWFGGGFMKSGSGQHLESTSVSRQPLVTGRVHDKGDVGPVIERHWMNSRGVAITISDNSTFEFSVNAFDRSRNATDGQLCFYSRGGRDHEMKKETTEKEPPSVLLEYVVCVGDSQVLFRTDASKTQPLNLPELLLDNPVWSTWGYFKDTYNQSALEMHAEQIHSKGYGQSLLMVDDGWEEALGDLSFDTSKFPAPDAMISNLRAKGFNVSLGVRLQVSITSKIFQDSTVQDFLVRVSNENVPGLSRRWTGPHLERWNRGLAGTIDVSDHTVAEWQRERMESLRKQRGIYAFHLSGNDVSSLPADPRFRMPLLDVNDFTGRSIALMSSVGKITIAESASRCQHLPVVVRLSGATSSWNGTGGLADVIPSVLTLGLLGYPAFIPDPIGGSAYEAFPSKELYIRWAQLSAFFPIMHFSIPPHHYDTEVEEIVRKLMELRNSIVLPKVRKLGGHIPRLPIIRPIWWMDPSKDEGTLQSSTSQFLLGDDILVAPVLDEGQRERSVYLPKGDWKDVLRGVTYSGPVWLRDYAVSLQEVAYFVRR